jgi:hypothetical protein
VAVLYVHALNPYGFSHVRRVTHENVDLNRNFHDFSQPLPANPAYRELAPAAARALAAARPTRPPSPTSSRAAATGLAGRHHARPARVPQGLFFGGQAPTWSNRTLRRCCATPRAQPPGLDRPAHRPGPQRRGRAHLRRPQRPRHWRGRAPGGGGGADHLDLRRLVHSAF